ncbi:MAG: hypothetical protein JST44_25620 [Cyanobacteria bacterium SZAS LIN-5]|nr:hypothetical protein [Cyanobacteria bacterium SZAS LIN-5]RTL45796.1 MAG: hypothetical protein EKK48_00185 [Candidatus Melainabacteria bacterium]
MDIFLFALVGVVAFVLLLVVSEPHRFLPESKGPKKKVGSTYWGAYEGCPVESPMEQCTIEIRKSTRKEKIVAGSQTYAAGRGVNMSGRG